MGNGSIAYNHKTVIGAGSTGNLRSNWRSTLENGLNVAAMGTFADQYLTN